jgi:hypothetical protein
MIFLKSCKLFIANFRRFFREVFQGHGDIIIYYVYMLVRSHKQGRANTLVCF